MDTNKLLINNNTINFSGFKLLECSVTFCLYSSGIVILPGWQPSSSSYYYKSKLNSNREIHDEFLICMLKDRGLSNEELFVQAGNHYVELTPHKFSKI